MADTLVLRRVRAFDPALGLDGEVDLVIERGILLRAGRDAAAELKPSERVRIIEGRGMLATPAFIDLHAHLREPGQEYKEDIKSGLYAAAAGGFADVCAMPNTRPVNDNRAITEMMIGKARSVSAVRLHPIGAITVGQKGEALTEMADLKDAGAIGLSDDGRCVTSSAVMRSALEYATTFDLPIIQHAEDHALTEGAEMHEGAVSTRLGLRGWPRVAEDIIVARDVILAEYVGARYHLAHASTQGAVRILREAKSRGIKVTAEVTPHHLLLTDKALLGYDAACKVNPPLREDEDVDALRQALADGTIDCIATDHAPHSSLEKDCEFASAAVGINGLELAMPLLFDLAHQGVVSPMRLADALSTAPTKLLPDLEAGSLRVGARADVAVFDPALRWQVTKEALRSRSHNTPWLGKEVVGAVVLTLVAGRIVHERAS